MKKEWDRLSELETETVPQYVDKFWEMLLKVIPFNQVSDAEKMRKFEAGLRSPLLQKAMKLYPRGNLQILMESARIVDPIHDKGTPRKQE